MNEEMNQGTLFGVFKVPVAPPKSKRIPAPPVPPKPVIQAEPLGPCVKSGCKEPATLKSPSGALYCQKHGYCQRRTCLKNVQSFVWHSRLERYVCSCVLKFEKEMEKTIERSAS